MVDELKATWVLNDLTNLNASSLTIDTAVYTISSDSDDGSSSLTVSEHYSQNGEARDATVEEFSSGRITYRAGARVARRRDLGGVVLRVGLLHSPPYTVATLNETTNVTSYEGWSVEMLETLAHALNFEYEIGKV